VAFCAHVVPVKILCGPVQWVVCWYFFIGVEVVPFLSALFFCACVPCDGVGL